jgi:transcriptional antiterminator RfaH
MDWYAIHTKPRQEQRALKNLISQGYDCYLPLMKKQIIRAGSLQTESEPLFPRYLFICLDSTQAGKSWSPIRSTLGVSRLVTFGSEPARVASELIEMLRDYTAALATSPTKLHRAGDLVRITEGPFAGLEAIFEMDDGESRAMVLIELLSRPTRIKMPISSLARVS